MEFFSLNGNRRLCEKCLCAMNIMFKSFFKLLLMGHHPLNKERAFYRCTTYQLLNYRGTRGLKCETTVQKEPCWKGRQTGKQPEKQLGVMRDLFSLLMFSVVSSYDLAILQSWC